MKHEQIVLTILQCRTMWNDVGKNTGTLLLREDRGTLHLPHCYGIKTHGHLYVYAITYLHTRACRSLRYIGNQQQNSNEHGSGLLWRHCSRLCHVPVVLPLHPTSRSFLDVPSSSCPWDSR